MKRWFLLLFLLCQTCVIFAQSHGIQYQALIIDENVREIPGKDIEGNYLPNYPLEVRFTLIDENGEFLYREVHSTQTDPFGMINLVIGMGEPTSDSPVLFNEIDWNGSPVNLEVELNLENSSANFSSFSQQPLYFVPYAFHRNITATGSLVVEGEAEFGGESEFNELTVEGTTDINGDLSVNEGAATNLSGSLSVTGASTFESSLSVNGNAFLQDLQISNQFTVSAPSTLNGQVTIDADVNGNQGSYDAYPLRVQGSNQGIAIRVDGGREQSKNYITFFDATGAAHGRIEGQTLSELQNSFRFIWDFVMAGLDEAFVVAEGVACGGQLDLAEVGVMAVAGLAKYAHWVELAANAELNVGVAFVSGGADYAEWLPRKNVKERLMPGEIVGVSAGTISRNTNGATHLLVISTNPVVVGNIPEESLIDQYEKVAFMGQVPVRVVGAVAPGDYILPSGNQDGLGIAVPASQITAEQLMKVVGVAWEGAQGSSLHLVNVAVGLQTHILAQKISHQQQEIDAMKNQLDHIMAMLQGDTLKNTSTSSMQNQKVNKDSLVSYQLKPSGQINSIMSDVEFEAWINDYGYIFEDRMGELKSFFESRQIDTSKYPEIESILENPTGAFRDMREGKYMPTLWQSLEQRYLSNPAR